MFGIEDTVRERGDDSLVVQLQAELSNAYKQMGMICKAVALHHGGVFKLSSDTIQLADLLHLNSENTPDGGMLLSVCPEPVDNFLDDEE